MKNIFLLIISLLFLFAACKATPGSPVIKNKKNGELEAAIQQTAAPEDSPVYSEATATKGQKISEPVVVKESSSNASNTVHVNIDAEVINVQPANIPIARIAQSYFKEEDVAKLAKTFYGDTQFYEGTLVKSDFDTRILNLQYRISSDEELLKSDHATAGGITDLSELRAHYKKSLDRMIEDRNNAPDERSPLISFMEAKPYALADLQNGYMGRIIAREQSVSFSAFEDGELYPPSRTLVWGCEPYRQLDIDNPDTQFQSAKQKAIDMISQMGIDTVLGDVYLIDDSVEGSNRKFNVFCFEKVIGDSKLDHTLAYGGGSSFNENVYGEPLPYERLELWTEGDKFVQFRYSNPMHITEIVNENVALNIDCDKAVELAKQYAYVTFIDAYGNYGESRLDINKIELVLARTKQADTRDYIVVPAWNFYGLCSYKANIDDGDYKAGDWVPRLAPMLLLEGYYPLITINALDGSIIDMERGY